MSVCPLIFEPIFRTKVWGGRRLEGLLGKRLPADEPIGESWELADLPNGQGVVARGSEKGRTLQDLIHAWGPDLLGRARLIDGRFPLLIKFLDATDNLSIQVHPDEQAMSQLGLTGPVKHEAWYVVYADSKAFIYRGLADGVTRDDVQQCLNTTPQSIVNLFNRVGVKTSDAFYLPSGTVHALGAGVVVAEVQTPCDVTYRLYDWGRMRPEADRGLHVDAALRSIRTDLDAARYEKRSHVTSIFTTVTRLIDCPSFRIEKVRFVEGVEQDIPYAEPVCWIMLEGEGEIAFGTSGHERFAKGEVVLLPAGLKSARLKTHSRCTWLEVTLPVASDLAGFERPDKTALHPIEPAMGLVPLNIQNDRKKPQVDESR